MSDICYQSEPSECGLACIVMLASLIGKSLSLESLRGEICPDNFGLSLYDLETIGNKKNLSLESVSFNISDLEFIPTPAILHLKTSHYVIVKKVNSEVATIIDPSSGKRVIPTEYLRQLLTGYALITNSEKENKNNNSIKLPTMSKIKNIDYKLIVLAMISTLSAFIFPMFAFSSPEKLLAKETLEWGYLLGFLLLALCGLITNYMLGKRKIEISTKEHIKECEVSFKKSIMNDINFFEKRNAVDVANRISAYAGAKSELSIFYYTLGISILVSVISLSVLLYIDIIITACVLFFMAISFFISSAHKSKAELFRTKTLDYLEDIDRKIIDSCNSSVSIREASGLQGCVSSLRSLLVSFRYFKISEYNRTFLFSSAVTISDTFNNVLMMYLLFAGVVQGSFEIGLAFSFILVKGIFNNAINELFGLYIRNGEINVAIDRASDMLTFSKDPIYKCSKSNLNYQDACIKTSELTHNFIKGTHVNKITFPNLSVDKSNVLIINGSSGTGKSTLLKLLSGHYKLCSGEVFLAGSSVTQTELRNISYYHGQVQTFIEGTVLENIKMFNDNVTRNKVEEVLDTLGIRKIIESLPEGLDSKVSEESNPFSVGEKQRILLSRAFVSSKNLILLDEPTSSLDHDNSLKTFNNILKFNKTIIMVTHNKDIIENNNSISLSSDAPHNLR